MAVTASTLFSRVRSMLDDDNSARYTDADDLVPAMNSAIGYLTTLFSAAFEQNKLQPFALSELTEVWIFDVVIAGTVANVNLNEAKHIVPSPVFNDNVWSIIGVEPNPAWTSAAQGAPETLNNTRNRFAARLPIEEFNYSTEDPFSPGYDDVPDDFKRVCYTGPGNYFLDGDPYLLLRPISELSDTNDRVGVWMLMNHPTIASSSTELLFPVNVHPLIEQKMLQYITYQSDDDRLFKITDKEVKELIQLMN